MNDDNDLIEQSPFQALSNSFIESQRSFNTKVTDLRQRLERIADRSKVLSVQLNSDPFRANISSLINIEEESRLILLVAKELEKQREDILTVLEMLNKTKEIKLNK